MEEVIKESLDYDESTGEFYWKTRPQSHFKNRQSWSATNTKFAGKLAGVVRKIDGINYRFIKINQVIYGAYILAWIFHKGSLPKLYIDHIDGNGLNNKMENLIEVTASINSRNCKLYENSTTKICGVYWIERVKKWLAKGSIRMDGKRRISIWVTTSTKRMPLKLGKTGKFQREALQNVTALLVYKPCKLANER